MRRGCILIGALATAGLVITAAAQERAGSAKSSSSVVAGTHNVATPNSAATHGTDLPKAPSASAKGTEASLRLEGEKRFRTNCGRCHQPPHKFPPRVMATAIRHMRVRAMITDEDMRLILRYMTE